MPSPQTRAMIDRLIAFDTMSVNGPGLTTNEPAFDGWNLKAKSILPPSVRS